MTVVFDLPVVRMVLLLWVWAKWVRPCHASNVAFTNREGWAVKEDLLVDLLSFVLSASPPFWCHPKRHKFILRAWALLLQFSSQGLT
jgi:hypothetical protein